MTGIKRQIVSLAIAALLCGTAAFAQETVKLPAPKIRGQLMRALKNRVSFKGFSPKELSGQRLGDVLWAGFGVNNDRTGRRTASSAFNAQEIDLYVLSAQGSYRYDAPTHSLIVVNNKDIREIVATQGYTKTAPVHIVYVADYDRANEAYPDRFDKEAASWAMMHSGFIAQNIELYCTVNKMSAVVRLPGDCEQLRRELRLGEQQELIVSQAVGYLPEH